MGKVIKMDDRRVVANLPDWFDNTRFELLQDAYRAASIRLISLSYRVREAIAESGNLEAAAAALDRQADLVTEALDDFMDFIEKLKTDMLTR